MPDFAVDEMSVDKAFYTALKLHVYSTLHGSLLRELLKGETVEVTDDVKLQVGRFTARKTSNLFVPGDNGAKPGSSSEFYGFTSHKVREKLKDLDEEEVLEYEGKGLRDAHIYRWDQPLKHWEICSFMRFRRYAPDDLTLLFELSRAFHEFGTSAFTFNEFFEVYKGIHEDEFATTRWGRRKWKKLKDKPEYLRLVKGRIEDLVDADLVTAAGEKFAVQADARDAVHHFDLFVNGTPFHPSLDMCQACPLEELCEAGSTQELVRSFNDGHIEIEQS
jgi:hypothetical protein